MSSPHGRPTGSPGTPQTEGKGATTGTILPDVFAELDPPYSTIVADPPWHYEGFPPSRWPGRDQPTGERNPMPYSSMTLDEIKALPVKSLAAPDAHLYLWTTNRYLDDAFDVLRGWGRALHRQRTRPQRSEESAMSDANGEDVRAALRDASWHDRPNVRSVKQYHVVIAEGISACDQGQRRLVLAEFTERPATEVAESQRCRRPGCRVRWPVHIGRSVDPPATEAETRERNGPPASTARQSPTPTSQGER